jgi:hypothetical protein
MGAPIPPLNPGCAHHHQWLTATWLKSLHCNHCTLLTVLCHNWHNNLKATFLPNIAQTRRHINSLSQLAGTCQNGNLPKSPPGELPPGKTDRKCLINCLPRKEGTRHHYPSAKIGSGRSASWPRKLGFRNCWGTLGVMPCRGYCPTSTGRAYVPGAGSPAPLASTG